MEALLSEGQCYFLYLGKSFLKCPSRFNVFMCVGFGPDFPSLGMK